MSSAFIRESEGENLNEVEATLPALLFYLRRENGGISVHELKNYYSDRYKRDVYEMSDGLTYAINDNNKWYIILD